MGNHLSSFFSLLSSLCPLLSLLLFSQIALRSCHLELRIRPSTPLPIHSTLCHTIPGPAECAKRLNPATEPCEVWGRVWWRWLAPYKTLPPINEVDIPLPTGTMRLPPGPHKLNVFSTFTICGLLLTSTWSGLSSAALGASWSLLGVLSGSLWVLLGVSWAPVGPSETPVGCS